MRVAHLSRIRGPADGGISLIVEELLQAQRRLLAPSHHDSIRWLASPDHVSRALGRLHPDLVHLHGLWSGPSRLLARRPGLPAVIAPQGMLDPWALARSRWRKRAAWALYERDNLQRAGAVQALCTAELEVIRAQGISSPVAIIPNAVSLPPSHDPSPALARPPWKAQSARVLLFLSRFHEKKGVDPLLRAWQSLAEPAQQAGWQLVLVGYGDQGRLARRVAAAQHRGELTGVQVLGPCFGAEKQACFSAASAFVLPSFSEGLPMAALEAMAHGLPCLLSAACNLPDAFSAGAALPAEPDPAALAIALRQLFALSPAERAAMGGAGRALVAERYTWPRVAEQTLELYRWILGGGEPPGFVEVG